MLTLSPELPIIFSNLETYFGYAAFNLLGNDSASRTMKIKNISVVKTPLEKPVIVPRKLVEYDSIESIPKLSATDRSSIE